MKAYEEIKFPQGYIRWIREGDEYVCRMSEEVMNEIKTHHEKGWQGLTDEEIREFEIWLDDEEEKRGWNPPADIVKYIEAKLREKNGG